MSINLANGGGSVADAVISIATNRVRPFADQPREYFDPGELISLELSMKQRGQLQPAMVRLLTDDPDHDYELVDGQRRWHACTKLKIPFRAVIIDPEDPEDQYEISVAANFQRADHTPMEIANAIERMCTQGKRTEQYVALLFGKSGAWVNLQRRLIHLVPEIQAQLTPNGSKDQLPVAIAVHLARLPKEQQLSTLQEIQARGLSSVRAADKIRRMLLDGMPEQRKRSANRDNDRQLQRYVRRTIQDADRMFDRMGPDEFRMMVGLLTKRKSYDELRDNLMTAIGRLEVLHRRLTECRSSVQVEAPARKSIPTVPAAAPEFVHSHPMKCPKCGATGTRFRRWSNANLEKEHWECLTKGCLLKISHYQIKIDRNYEPPIAAAAGA